MDQLSRDTLRDSELVWLLEITFAGQTFRWSSRPISITNADGESLPYDGSLNAPDIEQSLSGIGDDAEPLSIGFDLFFPSTVVVAEQIAKGFDLAAARGELSLIAAGSAYEDRQLVLVGAVVEPEYGGTNEPVSFTLEEQLWDDTALIPGAAARVTASTWSGAPTDSLNLYYPIVFGYPGQYSVTPSATTSGSPAIAVEVTGSNVDTLLIAGHHVEATTVVLFYDDSSATISVTNTNDSLGNKVAVLDISGQSTAMRTASSYWIGWKQSTGGGVVNPETSEAYHGAGEVLVWLLGQSTLAVDSGRWEAVADHLNRYKLSGYIDDAVRPWEYVVDNVLPLLPMAIQHGPSGLYPIIWRHDASSDDAVAALTVSGSTGVSRIGRVQYDRGSIVNQLRIEYSKRARTGEPRKVLVVQPTQEDSDADQRPNYFAGVSQDRYGVSADSLDTDIIYDDTTAGLVANWIIGARAFATRTLSIRCGKEYGWLGPGDVVTVTDDSVYLESVVALLHTSRWISEVELELKLSIIENPPRDAHVVG
jgi:hypothetical protein